jgi:hypothetical protein
MRQEKSGNNCRQEEKRQQQRQTIHMATPDGFSLRP